MGAMTSDIHLVHMCSLQTGQRLKIDIRNDAIQKENDPEAHAALNRMSTLLRDVSS